jgi:hypothetical protein
VIKTLFALSTHLSLFSFFNRFKKKKVCRNGESHFRLVRRDFNILEYYLGGGVLGPEEIGGLTLGWLFESLDANTKRVALPPQSTGIELKWKMESQFTAQFNAHRGSANLIPTSSLEEPYHLPRRKCMTVCVRTISIASPPLIVSLFTR